MSLMSAIREKLSAFSFLRKHPVFFVIAMLAMFLLVLVLIAAYSSPPQTVSVDPRRRNSREDEDARLEPVATAYPPAAAAVILPGMSRRAERIMGLFLAALGIALSIMILRIVK